MNDADNAGGKSAENDGGGSTVGLRCSWRCALCGEQAASYQLARLAAEFVSLRLPRGWKFEQGASICPVHTAAEWAPSAPVLPQ